LEVEDWKDCPPHCPGCKIEYKGDTGAKYPGGWDDGDDPECPKWKSPYHMHRWQSRINLEIKSIRVERLQQISEEDAKAEGCELAKGYEELTKELFRHPYREVFQDLWNSINTKRGFPWASNPWVWVIEAPMVTKGTIS
jgi:hypothetical protein